MPKTHPDGRVHIGQLAAEFGINPKTLRYYEDIGLLAPAARTHSGYRLYGAQDRERLGFIGQAKAVGLSLAEIREVLALRQAGRTPCGHVLALLDEKLAAVAGQLQTLLEVQHELRVLRETAQRTQTQEACICGIIEAHSPPLRPHVGHDSHPLRPRPVTPRKHG